MKKWIEKIKSKPESYKRGIALFLSLGVTGVCAFFWFISYSARSAEILQKKHEKDPLAFLKNLSDEIGESYNKRFGQGKENEVENGDSYASVGGIGDNGSSSVPSSASSTSSEGSVEQSMGAPMVAGTSTSKTSRGSSSPTRTLGR